MTDKDKNRRPTIYDVALEAKVSPATVSSVINKSRFVSEDKKKKVNKAISKLNYRINPIARGLRKKSLRTVGIVVPDIAEVFYSQVIAGMEEEARKRNYTLVLCCTFYNKEEEEKQTDILLNQSVDGIIFFSGSDNCEIIDKVKNNGTPIVLTDRQIEDDEISSVLIDNKLAMENIVDYLIRLGHKKIAYITMNFNNQTTVKERYMGYCESLRKHGISIDENLIMIDNEVRFDAMKRTYSIVDNFLKMGYPATAFIAIADFMALGAMKAIEDNGHEVPKDISVVGFNSDSICEYLSPPLTSVKQPKKTMGKTAMSLLIDKIEGKKIKNKKIVLPVEIIERGSVIEIS